MKPFTKLFISIILILSFATLTRGIPATANTFMATALLDSITSDSISCDTLDNDTLIAEEDLAWPYNVTRRIDNLLDNDMFSTSTVGMMVYDLTADSVIYRHNEKQLMRPASTMKMIVSVAALDNIGYEHEYRTILAVKGDTIGKVFIGNIYCKGDFDPAFNKSDLDSFVNAVKMLGADTIRGNIIADLSMKDELLLGEGWCWDDDNPILSPLLLSRKNNFMECFIERLNDEGITIEGNVEADDMPRSARIISIKTRTVADILPRLMKLSDNLYAETLFYHLASSIGSSRPATAKAGRQMVNRLISKVGHKPSHYYIADGSGLSLYNYVSPELETDILRYAYHEDHIFPYLFASMPIAGKDGTLSKRMQRGYACGNVHAKTGTVTGVSALAGYCTAANGHVLCFSIINMGIRNASTGRRFQDKVCQALCRP
ncbi:MAG: D-alanyl-D-alanine carboxypeptidase/D-alanyl-D-alanine-endopeptidase [Prevotella sp.]